MLGEGPVVSEHRDHDRRPIDGDVVGTGVQLATNGLQHGLNGAGEAAFVVGREGSLAWIGHPVFLGQGEAVLRGHPERGVELVVDGVGQAVLPRALQGILQQGQGLSAQRQVGAGGALFIILRIHMHGDIRDLVDLVPQAVNHGLTNHVAFRNTDPGSH